MPDCDPGYHAHGPSYNYCHPVERKHQEAQTRSTYDRPDVDRLLQNVGPDSSPAQLRQAALQLRRSGDPGLGAVAFFLAEAGDALHYGRRDEAQELYQRALRRAAALTSGQQLSLRAHLAGVVARRAAAQLAKDIGAAGAPVTGGMVGTPVAGSGIRRRRRERR